MRKSVIGVLLSALLLLTGADCQGSKPNPRNPSPQPNNKWVCATAPVDCPVQSGWQDAPSIAPMSLLIPLPSPNNQVTRSPQPVPTLPPVTILLLGDSLTVEPSYGEELSRLMNRTGQPHTRHVVAAPGSKCSWWVTRINDLITQYQPHMLFLNCGTNDTPSDNTEADYRAILATGTARGVQVIASLIGIPDMRSPTNTVRPYILDWMHNTNLAIKRALVSYPQVGVADIQRVPANPEWLQADGIHWTSRARAAVGQIFYQAAVPVRGWKTLAQMGTYEMCGLSGTWITDPWPANYRVCLS